MKVISTSTDLDTQIPTLPGEETQVSGLGTFGGATITLETYVDGQWRAVPDGAFTAPFEIVRVNGPGTQLRATVSNVSGTTNLSVSLTSLP